MFSREVNDITIGTLSAIIMYMLVLSPSDNTYINTQIVIMAILIFSTFLHLIFKQLNRLTTLQSMVFLLIYLILITTNLVLSIIDIPGSYEGFWSFIGIDFLVMYFFLIILTLLFSVDGYVSTKSNEE